MKTCSTSLAALQELFGCKCKSKLPQPWHSEVDWLIGKFCGKSIHNITRTLAWASTVYYVWQERSAGFSKEFHDLHLQSLRKLRSRFELRGLIVSIIKCKNHPVIWPCATLASLNRAANEPSCSRATRGSARLV